MRIWSQRTRFGLFVVAAALGSAGLSLVLGSLAVTYPGMGDRAGVTDQPSPAWIWELGLVLGGLGALILGVLYLAVRWSGPPLPDDSARTPNPQARSRHDVWVIVGAWLVLCAGLIVASVASPDSELQSRPWLLVLILTGFSGWQLWKRFDED